jgi:hypothetical protein
MFIWEFLIFVAKKINFHFISAKIGIFCEASTKNMLQKLNNLILENIIPYIMHNLPVVCMEKVL